MAELPGQPADGGTLLSRLRHSATRCVSTVRLCATCKGEQVEEHPSTQEGYVQRVLAAYRATPGTAGTIRRPDRLLAAQLYERGVPLPIIENALVLVAARRLMRPIESPPLTTIRSLAYFKIGRASCRERVYI